MAYTTSSNMSLTIPSVGSQPGPDYASNINNSLTLIDQHDHSQGRGVQITPDGLNINTALNMQDNSLTNVTDVVFSAQTSSSTVQALYVAPGTESPAVNDLFFNDGDGNIVQLTSGGAVNATAASIPGESYAGGTFFWKQGTGSTTPANFDIGSITLRPNTAATTNGVRLSPPSAISTQYDIALPELPASTTNILSMDVSGNMFALINVDNSTLQLSANVLSIKNLGVTTAKINTEAVTEDKLADDSVSTRTIIDGNVTRAKLNDDVRLQYVEFDPIVASFSVRVATTVNGTMSTAFDNGSTVDGVVLATNDLILIKNQTAGAANGVYVVQASGNPVRSTSYDSGAELTYAAVSVTAGTVNTGRTYYQNNVITNVGADVQSWSRSSTQEWVVPTDVTTIDVKMAGGGGGGGCGPASSGGASALGGGGGAGVIPQVTRLNVTSGETLIITTGGNGDRAPGGGAATGSTGGTSSIKRGSTVLFQVAGGAGGGLGGNSGSGTGIGAATSVTAILAQTAGGSSIVTQATNGGSSQYASGGTGGTAGSSSGGFGGGGGGAGMEDGGAGGAGGPGSTSTPGAIGLPGGVSAGGGGGGAGANTSASLHGGDGGPGYVSISYF